MSDNKPTLHDAASTSSTAVGTTPQYTTPATSTNEKSVTAESRASSDSTRNVLLRDFIIGFSDGLTVPFALTAALTTLDSSRVVISGGLAELFAGSLSMGIGAVLASLTEGTQFKVEEQRIKRAEESDNGPDVVVEMLARYGVSEEAARGVVDGLKRKDGMWVQFVMDFDLKLSEPSYRTAPLEGLVMGIAYLFGGLLPMIPYFILQHDVQLALYISIAITAVVCLIFGWLKAQFIHAGYVERLKSALWTLFLCGVAAGVSYGIVWGIDHHWPKN